MRAIASPIARPAAVTARPAPRSMTKWLAVTTVDTETSGPQIHPARRIERRREAAATAIPHANANPQCRLGTAAKGL